jgi:hypothetical protein
MRLTPKTLRRGAGTAAVISAAILLPAVALAAPGRAGTPQAAAAARCARSQLTSWIGEPGSGTAGSTYYELEISNVSRHTCTLYGYPGVSALGSGGKQVGRAARREGGHAEDVVTLGPSQTAHVILQVINVAVFLPSDCHPATADSLRVYAPGDYGSMVFPFAVRACAKHGPVFLNVTTVLAGTGIPGYSN